MIALTGATGFLGSAIAHRLKEKQLPFRCLVRKNSKKLDRIAGLSAPIIETDFTSAAALRSALDGCDLIIHCAGLINGSQSALRQANVESTQNLALAAADSEVKKFVLISSVAATMKHGPYGLSKAEGEDAVKKSGIPYLFFRPAWIFGPGDTTNSAMMIRTLKSFPLIPLLGGGTFKIQPVYVSDAVDLILQGVHFSRVNTAYTVAGGEQVSLKTILETFAGHLKLKRIFVPIPLKPLQAILRVYLALNPWTKLPVKQILELDKHEAFDISETRRDFNFNPMPFSEGAKRMFSSCAV